MRRRRALRKSKVRDHIAVVTPSGDHVAAEFSFSLSGMMQSLTANPPDGLVAISQHNLRGSILPDLRRRLVLEAQKAQATHLLMIDSDMVFPADTAARLYSHHEPVVVVNARMRRPPYSPCAQAAPGEPMPTTEDSTGLSKAHASGFALAMLDMRVFEKVPSPWFGFEWDAERAQFVGEDHFLCRSLREHDIPILVDHDLSKEVAHMFQWGLTIQHGMGGES